MDQNINSGKRREFLSNYFDENQLINFCFDNSEFRNLYREFDKNHTDRETMVRKILEHARQNGILQKIDEWVRKENPNRYNDFFKSTIKILFLASNPKDTDTLDLDKEIQGIQEVLSEAKFKDKFDIKQQWATRTDDLQKLLLRYEPHIVHFCGHGSEDTHQMILENENGMSHPVSRQALEQLFALLKRNIRCVVLNACQSHEQAQAIANHIDCVVGMSKEIGDEAAIKFAAAFYTALGEGENIQTAFNLGCNKIHLDNLNEQDIPQLLCNAGNAHNITFGCD